MHVHIDLQKRAISVDDQVLTSRNRSLPLLVAFLAWRFQKHGVREWVSIETLGGVLGHAHPKQYQRYLNALENKGLRVVAYENRTCGPWRLADAVGEVSFDLSDAELTALFPPSPQPAQWQDDDARLLTMIEQISKADVHFADGDLESSRQCFQGLCDDEQVAPGDADLAVLVQLRIARLCTRHSRWDEAAVALDRAERMLKHQTGAISIDLSLNLHIARAKLFYDRGCFSQAMAILKHLPMQQCHDALTLAQYHNLAGLFEHRYLRLAAEADKPLSSDDIEQSLHTSLGHYRRALIFYLLLGDYFGVQAVAFNIGNVFACSSQYGWADAEICVHERAIRWFKLCMTLCNKHSLVDDSVLCALVMVKTAIARQMPFSRFLALTENWFVSCSDWPALGQWVHQEAVRIGNRLEIAESLQLRAEIEAAYGSPQRAKDLAQQALDRYTELGRKDLARPLKKSLREAARGGRK